MYKNFPEFFLIIETTLLEITYTKHSSKKFIIFIISQTVKGSLLRTKKYCRLPSQLNISIKQNLLSQFTFTH